MLYFKSIFILGVPPCPLWFNVFLLTTCQTKTYGIIPGCQAMQDTYLAWSVASKEFANTLICIFSAPVNGGIPEGDNAIFMLISKL